MAKVIKNKESEKTENSATVKEVDVSSKDVKVKLKKKKKEYTPVQEGTGGQFVDIGGGVRIPASEA